MVELRQINKLVQQKKLQMNGHHLNLHEPETNGVGEEDFDKIAGF